MTILLSPADIKRIVGEPSKLGSGRSADEYEMERYQRVAIRAVANAVPHVTGRCPEATSWCAPFDYDCTRCWLAYLEGEAQCERPA
jgi:hypothetical protein